MLIRTLAVACLALCTLQAGAAAPVVGPYKHVPLSFDVVSQRMASSALAPATGATASTPLLPASLPKGVTAVSWAFAIGECGDEHWGESIDTERFAKANVEAFVQAGVGYIVSSGGQGQQFTCGSDAGMERFIARYDSPQLVGIDFDIEAGQSDADIDSLVLRAKTAQARHPRLRFSFTLPTHAASDGSRRSLNRLGERVLRAIRHHRLTDVYFNLMVMDYGDAVAGHCVLKRTDDGPRCDMGRSGLQAALNLSAKYKVPLDHIELTAMLGVNDVVHNVFTLEDAARLARDVRERGLAGLHHWSLDRDRACSTPQAGASNECSGLPQSPLDFTKALAGGSAEAK